MAENMMIALQITVIGMSLVFGAILLLWGVMAVLVRVLPEPEEAASEAAPEAAAPVAAPLVTEDAARIRKQRAAAIAVAVALALEAEARVPVFPAPPTATVSAWQAVMRGRLLKERGAIR
jgi:Na+-transporting methylmalonyl-CoA/oxaloacetate decarboxylase gamma subunit